MTAAFACAGTVRWKFSFRRTEPCGGRIANNELVSIRAGAARSFCWGSGSGQGTAAPAVSTGRLILRVFPSSLLFGPLGGGKAGFRFRELLCGLCARNWKKTKVFRNQSGCRSVKGAGKGGWMVTRWPLAGAQERKVALGNGLRRPFSGRRGRGEFELNREAEAGYNVPDSALPLNHEFEYRRRNV